MSRKASSINSVSANSWQERGVSRTNMQEERSDPSVRHDRLGLGQFRIRAGFSELLDCQPRPADDLYPSAQCPMEPRRPERCDPFALLPRQRLEPPTVYRVEVTPNLDASHLAGRIPQ